LGALMVFGTEQYLITMKDISYHGVPFPLLGTPTFEIIWGAAAGIIVMNWMPQKFLWKLITIAAGTLLVYIFRYFPEHAGIVIHSKDFSDIHNIIQDFMSLSLLVWLSEGFFGSRVHPK